MKGTDREQSAQQVQPGLVLGILVLLQLQLHLGGEKRRVALRLQDLNHL